MLHAVLNVSRADGLLLGELDLADDFLGLTSLRQFGNSQARPDVALLWVLLVPPIEQRRETLIPRLDAPIQLRREIIHRPIAQPFARIGVEFFVGVVTFDLRRIARPPDAERTDAKLYPRLGGVN